MVVSADESADDSSAQQIIVAERLHCGHAWGATLDERIDVLFSTRLTRSLGRCRADTGRITVAAWLAYGPSGLLREVVAHELAHVVVYWRHGSVQPHGGHWRALMGAAGHEPRACIPAALVKEHAPARPPPSVLHLCLLCGASRVARRTVPQWRCARCRRRGRSGSLEILRLIDPAEVA